jgi:hypothetical protein
MTNPIDSALGWISGGLLGTVAVTVAVIAIAAIGILMLSGRIDIRRSAWVIVGCFIIFGASTIAAGINSAITSGESAAPIAEIDPPPYYPPASPVVPQPAPGGNDPYAGAAVPRR